MPYLVRGLAGMSLTFLSVAEGTTFIPRSCDANGRKEVRRMVKGKMGKTYHCDICGQEVKVTKEGVGVLVCCNKPMREM